MAIIKMEFNNDIKASIRATISICCGFTRAGWHRPGVMHNGLCRDKHGGELGPTYYLCDSGLVMDDCGVMLPRVTEAVMF